MKKTIEKTFTDADGDSHKYVMLQFGAIEALALAPMIVDCVAEPLAKIISAFDDSKGFDPAGEEGEVKGASLFDADIDPLLAGRAVAELAQKIAAAGGADFLMKLLKHTRRDGENVSDRQVFNRVYQANFTELIQVVGWIVIENYASSFRMMRRPFALESRQMET